ncbi:chorismate mutase [Actinotignum sp. GS-2025g]|uniref:chorismate mutase n=1 Tax=Actinotignum sp. GS-2025g TaxID=3427280 RepID=UPI003F47612E
MSGGETRHTPEPETERCAAGVGSAPGTDGADARTAQQDRCAAELGTLRARLDVLDAQLIELLGQRKQVTDAVGRLKDRYRLPARDMAREGVQHVRIAELARGAGLDPDFAVRVHNVITSRAVEDHQRISRASRVVRASRASCAAQGEGGEREADDEGVN